ncbi:hypothetical protein D3C77_641320 [compost metagenome]
MPVRPMSNVSHLGRDLGALCVSQVATVEIMADDEPSRIITAINFKAVIKAKFFCCLVAVTPAEDFHCTHIHHLHPSSGTN